VISLLNLFFAFQAQAAPAPLTVTPGKISSPISNGVFTGGSAQAAFTLTKITRQAGRNGTEKWTLTYGDREGKPVPSGPGFFHVSVDRNGRRVVIDLAQVHRTAVDGVELEKMARGSNLVATTDMIMDPQDRSTNITMNMKSAVAVRVANERTSGGQLVLEISPTLPAKATR
jgi:hypothetical protein